MKTNQGIPFGINNLVLFGIPFLRPLKIRLTIKGLTLNLGKIQRLPRFDENDQVVARQITYISWSADHRCIEGAVMARFSNKMKAYLEQPAAMLLHTR